MIKIFILAITGITLLFSSAESFAQSTVDLEARVGKYYFSASGIVSPFASVVMTTQGILMSSTVADADGRFYLPRALINDGFNNFCLEAVDVRRIGTSYTCFDTQLPTRDFSKDEIFLPPTVRLSERQIKPNSSIVASGYTMPGSKVSVNLREGYWFQATADENGYYKTEIKDLPTGKYQLYVTAVYEGKKSEKPTGTFEIEVLGWFAMIPSWFFLILILVPLALIILLIILWKRRRKHKDEDKGKIKNKNSSRK